MKKLIKETAIACNVSERKLRALLTEIGLLQILNEAKRLQACDAFQEKRILFDGEPIQAQYLKEAFENFSED